MTLGFLAFGLAQAQAAPPTISALSVSSLTTTSATLQATLDPGAKATKYHFEYGPADCAANPCTTVPAGTEPQLAGTSPPTTVSAPISGLTAATTYHFRLFAKNSDEPAGHFSPDATFTTYAPPPLFGPCANDPLRAGSASAALPDCRAYEQATPVVKNGADARGLTQWVKAASDGSAVSFLSSSGIPGALGEQEIPAYLASRMESAWSTQGLLLPATLGDRVKIRGWTPDFKTVFVTGELLGQDSVLYALDTESGTISQPLGQSAGPIGFIDYAGASSDGSLVLLESATAIGCCPGALQGKPNLYLLDRKSGQLSLAGVLNDESAPPAGAVAGPYDWMKSDTPPTTATGGGSGGHYYTQDTHAISANGKAIFFTAEGSGALYRRSNPAQPQSPLDGSGHCTDPALACTVEISAPKRSGVDPLGQRPAAFMAAAADGSGAFFTSPEELTDDANTGPEVDPPAIQSAANSGLPLKSSLPIAAFGIAKDSEHLYWVNPAANAIGRSDLDGGHREPTFIEIPPRLECPPDPPNFRPTCPYSPEEVLPANPQYVTVDSGHIYWTNERSGNKEAGTIGRAKLDGDPKSVEAEWITGATQPRGIAVNDEYLYWANAKGSSAGSGWITRAKKGDGEEAVQFIPAFGTEEPEGVALDANHIYWTMNDSAGDFGSLRRNDLPNGDNQVEMFLASETEVRGIAVDSEHLYWAGQGDEAIGRMPVADFPQGPAATCVAVLTCERTFIPTAGKPKGLATDGTDLFWSVNGEVPPHPGNDLYHYDAANGELTDLTPDPDPGAPNGAEVRGVLGASTDAKRVYFAANGDLDGPGKAQTGNCGGLFFNFKGKCSLYLAEETSPGQWSTTFIAPLDSEPDGDGECGTPDATDWLARGSEKTGACITPERTALASADGNVLLFRSQEQLTAYETEGHAELYRYEADADRLGCISCNPTGQPSGGSPGLGSIGLTALDPERQPAYVLPRNLSSDGNRVFFESTDPLVVSDTNGEDGCQLENLGFWPLPSCQDVYEWEAMGSGSCDEDVQAGGCLYLISTGQSAFGSAFADASASGDDAFFATRSSLVGQDKDSLQDIYDARHLGGIAAQSPVSAPICEGEACKPVVTPPPPAPSPATATFTGPADPTPKHAKKKPGHRKKHHRHHRKRKAAHGRRTDR